MKKILVLYHANCPDGFGAAWVAWRKFGDTAEYVATNPHELPSEVSLRNRKLYILDNSFDKTELLKLRKNNVSVVVIDHHISAKNDVLAFPENIFDNNHSGAVLSWNYFHPKKSVPLFLEYVEAIDLWKFTKPILEITAYAYMQPFSFLTWNKIIHDIESIEKRKEYQKLGKVILAYEDQAVLEILEKAELVRFEGYAVFAVNFPFKRLTSILGHTLTQKKPPIGIVWYKEGRMLRVSLRGDGTVDVSKICEKYGGGGHKNAAGFEVPWTGKFPWKEIR